MLSKAVIFVFTTFGVFATLMMFMPNEFITESFNPSYIDPQIREYFEASDVLMYTQTALDNMTYPYSSLEDGPAPPDWEFGLPSGQYVEVWWSQENIFVPRGLEVRHTTDRGWLGYTAHLMDWKTLNGIFLDNVLTRNEIVEYWDSEKNQSSFYVNCEHISTSIILVPVNESQTIGEAWDADEIAYFMSYQLDWNSTGISAWTIVGQMLSFQIPNLGVPGIGGTILGLIISFPYYSLIAYIVYKLIAGLIPLVSGGSGD